MIQVIQSESEVFLLQLSYVSTLPAVFLSEV